MMKCPDCGSSMTVETHILYDEDRNVIELDFPVCDDCGHIAYCTHHETELK